MRRSPRSRLLTATIAAVASLALVACGGDDDDDTSSTADTEATAETEATADTADTADTGDTAETGDTVETSDTTVDGTTASSGEVGSREDYVAAAKEGFPVDDEELGDCIAEALITDDVFAQIEELGVTVDAFQQDGPETAGITLDEEQATAMADEVAACGDLAADILSEDELQCQTDNMSTEDFSQYVTFTLFSVDPGEDLQASYDAMNECLTSTTTPTT